MGAFVHVVEVAVEKETDRVVKGIFGEMKGVVGGHTRSGAAVGAIHIQGGGSKWFIGGTGGEGTKHLYYLNEGNGGHMIYPKRAKALHYSDGSFHPRSRPYAGIHFVESIASHYGG